MKEMYKSVKDFIQGTYLTLHERIDKEDPNLTPREYYQEANSRKKIQKIGGIIEFWTPLASGLTAKLVNQPIIVDLAVLATLPCVIDGMFRQKLYAGLIGALRKNAPIQPPEGYFYNKW